MGQMLVQYYDSAKAKGGLVAVMRLSMRSGVPPNKAAQVEDSPELLERFRRLTEEILGRRA